MLYSPTIPLQLTQDSKKILLRNIKETTDTLIAIMLIYKPDKNYTLELNKLFFEFLELSLSDNDDLFPTVKCDRNLINLLDKFNELQKERETKIRSSLEQQYGNLGEKTDNAV